MCIICIIKYILHFFCLLIEKFILYVIIKQNLKIVKRCVASKSGKNEIFAFNLDEQHKGNLYKSKEP